MCTVHCTYTEIWVDVTHSCTRDWITLCPNHQSSHNRLSPSPPPHTLPTPKFSHTYVGTHNTWCTHSSTHTETVSWCIRLLSCTAKGNTPNTQALLNTGLHTESLLCLYIQQMITINIKLNSNSLMHILFTKGTTSVPFLWIQNVCSYWLGSSAEKFAPLAVGIILVKKTKFTCEDWPRSCETG